MNIFNTNKNIMANLNPVFGDETFSYSKLGHYLCSVKARSSPPDAKYT